MNREIKFRAWCSYCNVMTKPFELKESDLSGCPDICVKGEYDNNGNPIDVEECEIMQYTGLKDKNGKEIYEGDIVKSSDGFNYAIEYSPTAYYIGYITESGLWDWGNDLGCEGEVWEVIGNIYENPELIS